MSRLLIVTRHLGAVEFLARHHVTGNVVESITTTDIAALPPHSVVVGVLPLHLAVAVVQDGHRFISIQLHNVEPWQRGAELSAEQMEGIASLHELQLEWTRDSEWQSDVSECWTGVPEASSGDCQRFRIGLVPRTAADIVAHQEAVADGFFPHWINAARYDA